MKLVKIKGWQKTSLIDFPENVSSVIFLAGCCFRCGYCHNPDLVLYHDRLEDIDEASLLKELEKKKGIIDGIVVSGGEPTMYNDLPQFIFKIKELGFLVKLDTNGSNPLMLKQLIDNGLLDYVAMDVKASIERYPEVVGRKIDLRLIKESIDILKKSKVDYEFRTTVVPGLVEEEDVVKIGAFLNGAKKFVIQNFRGEVNLVDNRYKHIKPFSGSELEKIKEKISNNFGHVEIR